MRLSLLQQTCVEDFGGRTVLPPGQLKSSSLLPFICLITKPLSSEIISQETPVSKIIDKGQAAGELRVQDPPFGSPRPPPPRRVSKECAELDTAPWETTQSSASPASSQHRRGNWGPDARPCWNGGLPSIRAVSLSPPGTARGRETQHPPLVRKKGPFSTRTFAVFQTKSINVSESDFVNFLNF